MTVETTAVFYRKFRFRAKTTIGEALGDALISRTVGRTFRVNRTHGKTLVTQEKSKSPRPP